MRDFPENLQKDKNFALDVNSESTYQLTSVLDNPKDFILEVEKLHKKIRWGWIPRNLRQDHCLVEKALNFDPFSLCYVDDFFKIKKDTVLKCVERNGLTLMFASDELKNDKEVAIRAVRNKGEALQEDFDVVLEACKQARHAIKFTSEKIKRDRRIFLLFFKMFDIQERIEIFGNIFINFQ